MTPEEYKTSLSRIEELFDSVPNSEDDIELEGLCMAVNEYEDIHYPMPKPTKEDIEEFKKDQNYKGEL